jgi:hypothetical protein
MAVKIVRIAGGDTLHVKTGGKIVPNSGTQAATIADVAALTGGESPTEAEFNALATKFNAVLAALEGVGILASS